MSLSWSQTPEDTFSHDEAHLFQKRFSGYLSGDIEADLPVAYIHLQLLLQLSHGATKIVEITLQYDMTKTRPDQVEIEAGTGTCNLNFQNKILQYIFLNIIIKGVKNFVPQFLIGFESVQDKFLPNILHGPL